MEVVVGGDDRLLAYLDQPLEAPPMGLVLVVHGLGGDSERCGVRRLGATLQASGFSVLRLNLRGAGAGRPLARGSYAAQCNRDVLPLIRAARRLCGNLGPPGQPLPLFGVGLSLGGTILLNACLEPEGMEPSLDRLACVSSPLDLSASSRQFERNRNAFYQSHLLRGLCRQLLADPAGVTDRERQALTGPTRVRTIRAFDAAITAPRWGFDSAAHYYAAASPLRRIRHGDPLPPTLLLQSRDDPWVPSAAAESLMQSPRSDLTVVLTDQGGHNGFHARESDDRANGRVADSIGIGCWSDRLVARWLAGPAGIR
jgi:predicted alpha/beta-fold hydrolase